MISLQMRLLLLAVAGIAMAMALAAFVLAAVFDTHVRKRYVEELDSHLHQLVALVRVAPDGTVKLRHELYDASFQRPFSGHYWQVNEGGKPLIRSKSLWDVALEIQAPREGVAKRQVDSLVGPRRAKLIGVERIVILRGVNDRRLQLLVAGTQRVVDEQRRDFVTTGGLSLAVIGGLLALASWLQVRAGLAPLRLLGRELDRLRRGQIERLDGRFPAEIMDVTGALNRLLVAQATEVERARANAGKLGHGLKTPLAVISAECRALRSRGEGDTAQSIEKEIDEMNAQITRVIAAARSVGPRQAVGTSTPILPAIGRLFDVMRRLPGGDVIDWRLEGASAGTSFPIDQRDLEEMLGNLLDNCRKWARSKVKVTVEAGDGPFRILVEDDGPGIPEDRLEDVLSGGFRLDRTVPGTGIGLAIATDLATLHGGKLEIGPSPLGGTKVMFSMGPA